MNFNSKLYLIHISKILSFIHIIKTTITNGDLTFCIKIWKSGMHLVFIAQLNSGPQF